MTRSTKAASSITLTALWSLVGRPTPRWPRYEILDAYAARDDAGIMRLTLSERQAAGFGAAEDRAADEAAPLAAELDELPFERWRAKIPIALISSETA